MVILKVVLLKCRKEKLKKLLKIKVCRLLSAMTAEPVMTRLNSIEEKKTRKDSEGKGLGWLFRPVIHK